MGCCQEKLTKEQIESIIEARLKQLIEQETRAFISKNYIDEIDKIKKTFSMFCADMKKNPLSKIITN